MKNSLKVSLLLVSVLVAGNLNAGRTKTRSGQYIDIVDKLTIVNDLNVPAVVSGTELSPGKSIDIYGDALDNLKGGVVKVETPDWIGYIPFQGNLPGVGHGEYEIGVIRTKSISKDAYVRSLK
jgi:hypothetical protein